MSETDRRGWLIISRREAEALLNGVDQCDRPPPDLARAVSVLERQLNWINERRGRGVQHLEPTIDAALERENAS